MLQSFAKYLTDTLYRHCPLSPQKRPIFQYGFEITTSTLSSAFSILLISIFLRDVLSACLFLGIFFFLRLFAGGYHAPTYAQCFILTNSVYLMVYLVSRVYPFFIPHFSGESHHPEAHPSHRAQRQRTVCMRCPPCPASGSRERQEKEHRATGGPAFPSHLS